jgi:hypothetical protein
MGAAPVYVTQGYGRWDEVDRPAATALTVWRGYRPIGVDLDLMLDNYREGTTIDEAVSRLEGMAGRGADQIDHDVEPPKLIVHTNGIMQHDYCEARTRRWVITDIHYDEESIVVNHAGHWIRAGLTVSLLQHVDEGRLWQKSADVRAALAKRQHKTRKPYKTKKGDNIVSVARTQLGDPGRWQEIVALNPGKVRDPRQPLKVGIELKMPY